MSEAYWQAKIWGLLHDPALKCLHNNSGRGGEGLWAKLEVMTGWQSPKESGKTILEWIAASDLIASASDRAAIGSLSTSINYAPSSDRNKGLEISHLLSGAKLENWRLPDSEHQQLVKQRDRANYLNEREKNLLDAVAAEKDYKKLFWWLWRCLPVAVCRSFEDESLMLMPAETRLPDASIWSHTSVTAALAGALAGYNLTPSEIEANWSSKKTLSHPYLATFSFTPVQELIKASRKMRDFWAGSWILHYLSAKVCWKLANLYGPDSLLYPSLYQQPLIDHWLLQSWKEFEQWITPKPSNKALLTAGFPNVLVLVLPKDVVPAAMQTARQTLLDGWTELANLVFQELHTKHQWMPDLQPDSKTWTGWLNAQWQTYWTALPIGIDSKQQKEQKIPLKNAAIPVDRYDKELKPWLEAQNRAYNILSREKEKLFQDTELDFLRVAYQQRLEQQGRKSSVNVGSWWPHIFDQNRFALTAVKNARTWRLPTAFGPRSTVSGLGPVVHPDNDWIAEGKTKQLWQRQAGLFDGIEQLNATETLKRGLHKVLPQLLNMQNTEEAVAAAYPDLTAGVAGYLKLSDRPHLKHFHRACQAVVSKLRKDKKVILQPTEKWGIPWIDDRQDPDLNQYHPRLLNSGWLIEDLPEDLKNDYRADIQTTIDSYYPSNNPTDWYVLAAGDGDGMSEWLKGTKLRTYGDYIPSDLEAPKSVQDSFQQFLKLRKRMGPATHNALSRALLDFSNQLVPYLTEQRYAGRLIYGGGDDVLAYTNLWEWDSWLWDIRQCFRGDEDPGKEFNSEGDYWCWSTDELDSPVARRPLFTMGTEATISFGIVIVSQSVPLAIALENLWEAEKDGAKKHQSLDGKPKDAVQVRVLYGNGNILKATSKFEVFNQWQLLLKAAEQTQQRAELPALFEQAAQLWSQHPAPVPAAIQPWTKVFGDRRDLFKGDDSAKGKFQQQMADFLDAMWQTTPKKDLDREIQNWLKLAAFVLRKRQINISLGGP